RYSFVLAAVASTAWLNAWQTFKVGSARKAAQVKYPQLYAEKAEAEADPKKMTFNCVQRAHQNTLESQPTFLVGTLITGLKYPYLAAGLGGGWVLGRALYTIGYATGDPAQVRSLS
ncbi:membrane-associated proteins in eicosanoid and glutathione metabolism, partial [Schizopora paradoxa]